MRCRWLWAFLAATGLLVTGCSAFVDQDQVQVTPEAGLTLEPGRPVGQTFVASHAGLCGVEVWLEAGPSAQEEIRLHLRASPQAGQDLASAVLPLAQITAPGFYRLSFAPLRESHGHYYYAFLEVAGGEPIQVGAGPGEAYLDGALYHDHVPLDAQMVFRLVYDPRWMLVDLGRAAVNGLGLLSMAGLLYVVPGWALFVWLWRGDRLSWAERLGIAAGLSLALYPLLFLWTDLVGLHMGPLYAWLPTVGGLVALVWRYRRWRPRRSREALQRWVRSDALWPDLALLAVMGMLFGVRLLAVRTLNAPMWGDSYQHTMIAQLLVDHGGLFDSWEPYAELQTFTYHFGFHAAVAAFRWLVGCETAQCVIWVGQILNGLAVVVLYPLAVRVSGHRWAGVGAVLAAGLLSPMPMFYVNWGRYTQLAGQAILPAAVLLTWSAMEARRRRWRLIVMACIAVGGLALTHYRVLVFYGFFVLAWVLLALRRTTWRRTLSRVIGLSTGVAVLFLPWFVHTFAGTMVRFFGSKLTTSPDQLSSFARQYNTIGDLTLYLGTVGWLLLVVAVAAGLWRRQRGVLLMSLWWFLLLIATNPDWLHLPGSGTISNFALFIAAYIPGGVLLGNLLARLVARLGSRTSISALVALVLVAGGWVGVRARVRDVHPSPHTLVTRPDLRAANWIQKNTPEDARFLIGSFFSGNMVVGCDGGWWLPLLARRANTVPPLNYGMEGKPWPGYRKWVSEPTRQIQEAGLDDRTTLALLSDRGITHVYIGQQQGRVNYEGPEVLDPGALLSSAHYRPVYHQDRVWVFEVVR